MRTIKINLEDEVFKVLEEAKERSGLAWDKFIIKSIVVEPLEMVT